MEPMVSLPMLFGAISMGQETENNHRTPNPYVKIYKEYNANENRSKKGEIQTEQHHEPETTTKEVE
jgi:hypothetical protein